MSYFIVWTDTDHSNIFAVRRDGVNVETITHRQPDKNSGPKVRHEMARQQAEHLMYRDVVPRLADAEGILILGPGVAKSHLNQYLITNHGQALGSKIVGVFTTDHPNEREIVELGIEAFQLKKDFFTGGVTPEVIIATPGMPLRADHTDAAGPKKVSAKAPLSRSARTRSGAPRTGPQRL